MKTIAANVLMLVAALCVYGFSASGEPGPSHVYFRVGYAVVGIACLAIALVLLARRGTHAPR
ncbi:MAG: hypothetical protein IT424_08715 [Pirellulales bacterium]|nr:hypothetical protein [Pirellulales bacterium]